MKKYYLSCLFLFLILCPCLSFAQVDDESQAYDGGQSEIVDSQDVNDVSADDPSGKDVSHSAAIPDDFTGTFAEDDPDSEVYQEHQIFGEDEAEDEEEEGEAVDEGPTHLLKLEFESQVVVSDALAATPFLEISYTLKLEQEIEVVNRRFRTKAEAQVTTDVVGTIAGNELFTCKLEVQLNQVEADIMARYTLVEETEETEAISQLAVQIKFARDGLMEDWFSNCLGTDGSILNTKGDREKYLLTTLDSVTPDLKGIVFESYDITTEVSQDIAAEPLLIEDADTHEEFMLQGSGSIEVTPIE